MSFPLFLIVVMLALALVFLAPFATIWALNTLFPVLGIPYTWKCWLAVLILSSGAIAAQCSKSS